LVIHISFQNELLTDDDYIIPSFERISPSDKTNPPSFNENVHQKDNDLLLLDLIISSKPSFESIYDVILNSNCDPAQGYYDGGESFASDGGDERGIPSLEKRTGPKICIPKQYPWSPRMGKRVSIVRLILFIFSHINHEFIYLLLDYMIPTTCTDVPSYEKETKYRI